MSVGIKFDDWDLARAMGRRGGAIDDDVSGDGGEVAGKRDRAIHSEADGRIAGRIGIGRRDGGPQRARA
jgi:hypothetical protein